MSLTSLRRDGSCSKFKIATESPLESQSGPHQNIPLKRGFPLCNHKRNGRRRKILYNQDLPTCFLFGLQNFGFLFHCKKQPTSTSMFMSYLAFCSGQKKKKKESMGHKASLDALVSFLPGSSCKNQFHATFSSPNLPCSAKFSWKWGFKIPHCQSFSHISFSPINLKFLIHFQPSLTKW